MTEEQDEQEVYTEERLDMERLVNDFADYLGQRESKQMTRGDRVITNTIHMTLTLATQGLYLFGYMGYQVYKFLKKNPMEKYKVEVEVKPKTSEEDEDKE